MMGRTLPHTVIDPMEPVLRRLKGLADLSEAEQALVLSLEGRRERHRAGRELLVEGRAAQRPRFVVSGWACNQRTLADGRRQVFGFALPGDGLGVNRGPEAPTPFTVTAVTGLETVDAAPLLEAVRRGGCPGILTALNGASRANHHMLLDHVVRLGRQTAYERFAHFLLEVHDRLAAVGMAERQSFPLPLTQEMLADTLGLSMVHINRTLQQMRRDRLVEWRSGVATILQRDVLISVADYHRPEPGLH
jgi:CRP-like cAMP-binding protein